jgi:UDP-2,3-diacylglucosamine pyrophosphatase LpxH
VYQEYAWEFCGVRHVAVHGHQFDRFVSHNSVLSSLLSAIHLGLQKMSFGKKRFMGFLERFDTAWLRLSEKVARGAIAHAKMKDARRVFCGHTHEALTLHRDGVEYYNSGSWTQEVPTYIAIDNQGARVAEFRVPSDSLEQQVKEELELDFDDIIAG